MDHKILCANFKPRPPMTLAAYFDHVTEGRAKPALFMSTWELDEVLRLIERRADFVEQAALLTELEDRFVAFGRLRGWIEPAPEAVAETRADLMSAFVMRDILGIKGLPPQDKTQATFKVQLKNALKGGLTSKGKTGLKWLDVLWDLGSAKNVDDVSRAFGKLGVTELTAWLKLADNRNWLMKHLFKAGGMSPVARNRLMKLIAARLTWMEVALVRVAWVVPWLTALDLFLTPERIADDATEARLTFLTVYGRVFSKRSSQFGRLVRHCAQPDWALSMPVQQALGTAIGQMH